MTEPYINSAFENRIFEVAGYLSLVDCDLRNCEFVGYGNLELYRCVLVDCCSSVRGMLVCQGCREYKTGANE